MWLTRLAIRQPVFVYLLLLVILLVGAQSYVALPRSLDPDVDFDAVMITTIWPGASPDEVETQITREIEDELAGLADVKRMTSTSAQGRSVIIVEFEPDTVDLFRAEQDIQARVNRADRIPAEAEEPFVMRLDVASFPVFQIAVGSTGSFERLRTLAEELGDRLEQIPGVSSVDLQGDRKPQIWVEADPTALEAHGLTLSDVIRTVQERNRNVPGGEIDTGANEYLVRAVGEAATAGDIERLILARSEGGGTVRIGDVATVTQTFEEADVRNFLDGQPCLLLDVKRTKGSNILDLFDLMRPILADFQRSRGHEAQASLLFDTSVDVRSSLSTLQQNFALGAMLVFLALASFLGWRNAIFPFIGMPVSFLITFILIRLFGYGLDGVSLFALILMVGIIVDDAIVVLENIHRHMEDGLPPHRAAVIGTREVVMPVVAATLTTMAAFAPLLLVPGIMGAFIKSIPLIVIWALSASLFECFFMLPSHIAHFGEIPERKRHHHPVLSRLLRVYRFALRGALRRRGLTLLLLAGLLIAMPSITPPMEFFPETDTFPRFDIKLNMHRGTTQEQTEAALEEVRQIVNTLPPEELVSVLTVSGQLLESYTLDFGANRGMASVIITRSGERDRTTQEIIDSLRPRLEQIRGVERLRIERLTEGPPTGADIEIRLRGDDIAVLNALAEEIKDRLRDVTVDGERPVSDVDDDSVLGKEEIRVRIDEERRALFGVSDDEIFTSIRAAIDGVEAAEITQGDEATEIVVRHPEDRRRRLEDLSDLSLRTQTGDRVRLREVAAIEIVPGVDQIRHFDRQRVVAVRGTVDAAITTPSVVYAAIEPQVQALLAAHPGYTYVVGGAEEENRKTVSDTVNALTLGIILIYIIIAAQFQSFIQPFIIMVTVPFAAVGVMLGLRVSDNFLTFPALIGIVALTGIVVNDAIVFIDFINRGRARHGSRLRAVMAAGRLRMRPILLTTVTTIGGLFPMALGLAGNAAVWQPMAVAICWGLAFSTVLTLIVIPVVYLTIDDIAAWLRRRFGLRVSARFRPGAEEI
ncbi:MAG: efflux RND transporter permease subunit [Candidatus Sumerlaeia bacterium]|nr:efflux RND transporter permease subunit [Candidatus Sumerlaeia bacterium]